MFSQPLYLTTPPDDSSSLFVVEKSGLIRIIRDDAVLDEPFLDLTESVSRGGEQGLLSLAFAPDFADTQRFFVNFTDEDGTTRIVGYTTSAQNPDRGDVNSRTELLTLSQPYSNHNGGQLQFGPDGRLYVGTGDGGGGGDPEGHAQNPDSLFGKILRFDTSIEPAKPEIYAIGLRNPWRFSFDRDTGALWISDVGQNEREEVDYLPPGNRAGANFGWNGYEGSKRFNATTAQRLESDELVWPVAEYGRDMGSTIIGGYVYRGAEIPALHGMYLHADFASGRVWAMDGPESTPVPLSGVDRQVESISSFGEDARGELYVVSLEGPVYRIVSR